MTDQERKEVLLRLKSDVGFQKLLTELREDESKLKDYLLSVSPEGLVRLQSQIEILQTTISHLGG